MTLVLWNTFLELKGLDLMGTFTILKETVLKLLKETGKLGSRLAGTPIEVNHNLEIKMAKFFQKLKEEVPKSSGKTLAPISHKAK